MNPRYLPLSSEKMRVQNQEVECGCMPSDIIEIDVMELTNAVKDKGMM